MHWNYGFGWHMAGMWLWWHMAGMWLWWLLPLALLIIGLMWFTTTARGGRPPSGDSPETILKRRYAKGEIDRETYERMLADLRK